MPMVRDRVAATTRRTALRLLLLLALVAGIVAALVRQPVPATEAERQQWYADSATYARELAVYIRDSTVIDSIAGQIPTDSMLRLYRAAATTRDPVRIESAIYCELTRLSFVYGSLPTDIALERIRKFRPPDRPGPSRVITKGKDCRLPDRPVSAAGSTSLRYPPRRPYKPRRPRGM